MQTSLIRKIISVGIVLPGLAIGALGMPGFFVAETLVAHAAGPWFVSPAGNDANDCLTAATACLTIQAAINKSSAGDVVTVAAGTYAEHVTVDHALILNGANAGIAGNGVRGTESVITGDATGALQITADNVTVDGFKVSSASNGLGAGIHVAASQSGAMITNNVITGNQIGIYANSAGASTISFNLFDANNEPGSAGGSAIYSEFTDHMTIDHNEIKNHTTNGPVTFAATGSGVHKNLTFSNNNLHDNTAGSTVFVLAVSTGMFSGNTILPGDNTGIAFKGDDQNVTVTNNAISGGARGVNVSDGGFGLGDNMNIAVNRNSFTGNTQFGVGNSTTSTPPLDATCNWWGAANGPGPVGTGSGDMVTTNVSFVQWLTSSDLSSPCNGNPNAPVISNVHIQSNNANPSIAKNGDIITLTFTTDQPVTKLGNFKINSSNPDTFTNVGNNYTATHLVDSGDPITGVPATFQINVKSAAGIFSQTIEATNDGSSVTIVSAVTLEAEDFGVVNFDTGLGVLKGYTAGFGLHGGPTFAGSKVVMQLFASSTLLQTNSSTAKVGATITGTQISSPFDVSGNFDYVADGFWTNVREAEFGQHLAATRVVATVTLADGTVLTAENDTLAGDPTTIMPNSNLIVKKIALGGGSTFSFVGDGGLGPFQIMTLPTSTKAVDSSGSQTFSAIAQGTYHITEATSTGWTLISNDCSAVVVAASSTATCTITDAKLGEIKGTKFEDRNGNGAVKNDDADNKGDGDHGSSDVKNGSGNSGDDHGNGDSKDNENGDNRTIAGVTIFLDANNNGILDAGEVSSVTDSHGNYDFPGLVPGVYHVREVVQPGWMQTAPAGGVFNITLAPGQVSSKNDFENFKLGSISGMKFNDVNGNGKKDAGDVGLSGWTIMLTGPTGQSATSTVTVTDAGGAYSFGNLGPGSYKLSEVMQTGWVQTAHPDSVKVQSGTVSTNKNFGNHLGPVTKPKDTKGHDGGD
jgi:SdrD B-like domain/Right handed beta helix region